MSTSHRLAVIPDVHMRRKMLHFAMDLHEEGYPLVFLGDYADKGLNGNDPAFLAELFAFAVKQSAVLLVGNHDLPYLFPERKEFIIEGFEPENAAEIADLYDAHRKHFRFVHREDTYLFSHAGLGAQFLLSMQQKYQGHTLDQVIEKINIDLPPELFYRSPYNGGNDAFDGPLWIRPEQYGGALQSEGMTQVVGHSSQASIRMKHNLLMIDVQLPLIIEW